jgi:hypothetical protein
LLGRVRDAALQWPTRARQRQGEEAPPIGDHGMMMMMMMVVMMMIMMMVMMMMMMMMMVMKMTMMMMMMTILPMCVQFHNHCTDCEGLGTCVLRD